jgi:hypothetical protein
VATTLAKLPLFALAAVPLFVPAAIVSFIAHDPFTKTPIGLAQSYLKATQARDYRAAYRFISAADRRVADEDGYIQAYGGFTGFALEVARMFAARAEFRLVDQEIRGDRARVTLDYKIRADDEFSSLLSNGDQKELNALASYERRRVLTRLAKMDRAQSVVTTEGRETLNLIDENGHWRIFLDLASRIPVSFDAVLPVESAMTVDVLVHKLFVGPDEPFQTNLKVKNLGGRAVTARIEHRIEPKEQAGRIAMIACGFLRPLTLQPGEERWLSSAYLLDPEGFMRTGLNIIFEFNLANPASPDPVLKRTNSVLQ